MNQYHCAVFAFTFNLLSQEIIPSATQFIKSVNEALYRNPGEILYNNKEEKRSEVQIKHHNYRKWPTRIPYMIDETKFIEDDIDAYTFLLQVIENNTCLKFVKRTNETTYIRITRSSKYHRCEVKFGMKPGVNAIFLGFHSDAYWQPCGNNYTTHAGWFFTYLLHKLALRLEHARFDRDNYVTINTENIKAEREYVFTKYDDDANMLTPYDYSSVLHYPSDRFSIGDGKKTIVPLRPEMRNVIGNQERFGQYDIHKINVLYKCQQKLDQCLHHALPSNESSGEWTASSYINENSRARCSWLVNRKPISPACSNWCFTPNDENPTITIELREDAAILRVYIKARLKGVANSTIPDLKTTSVNPVYFLLEYKSTINGKYLAITNGIQTYINRYPLHNTKMTFYNPSLIVTKSLRLKVMSWTGKGDGTSHACLAWEAMELCRYPYWENRFHEERKKLPSTRHQQLTTAASNTAISVYMSSVRTTIQCSTIYLLYSKY